MKILAVDDDSFILELIPMIIAQAGVHDVTLALSGEEALGIIAAETVPFDCFLFDIQMTGIDGIELCRRVRNLQDYRQTPIIMLTAMTERHFIDKAFAASATDFATKPFDVTDLLARIAKADLMARSDRQAADQAPNGDADPSVDAMARTEDHIVPLWVDGLDNIISLVALGNYLTVLSSNGQHSTRVFAVDANAVTGQDALAGGPEYTELLTQVARAIDATLGPHGYLMACARPGEFLCVSNSTALPEPEVIESEIQALLDEKILTFDDGDLMDVVIAVGDSILPGLVKAKDVDALFNRVIGRAKARAQAQDDSLKQPNIRPLPTFG
ncbi:response regulator [Tabrizicola piscis]|uniref:Response regulator n=1 Tax=Tabrizicola piscis TaxID=2494374 RepID=A0A3S8UAK9_9RHOB|nr:response regulator [Tabrizicola piscis]AZL60772.1 response regulator [Tabrizicola piscis]